jgi:hypothetical protein
MPATGETYGELGGDYFTTRDPRTRPGASSVGTVPLRAGERPPRAG